VGDTYRNPPERSGGGCVNGGYHDYVLKGHECDDGGYADEFTVNKQGRGWYRVYKCSKCGATTTKDGYN